MDSDVRGLTASFVVPFGHFLPGLGPPFVSGPLFLYCGQLSKIALGARSGASFTPLMDRAAIPSQAIVS
jgi:hypothetical protein